MFEKQKDYVKAMESFMKAAAQNDAFAQNKIGDLYRNAWGFLKVKKKQKNGILKLLIRVMK
ncbi:MAG: hypothetical protein JNJ47_07575 [Alphaproteobacteria bacterium]|nr:hypothetical protein [Alphaproteobacteria bacterium]